MSLTTLAIETAVKGIEGLAIKSFGEFLKGGPLRSVKQQGYNWSDNYVKKYLKRHGQIQVLGMSQAISLDDIYTNVRMLDAGTVKRLESVDGLEKVYREANQRGFGRREFAKQKGMKVANTEQYLCVLGGPGIGKTTYLRKVGLEALLRKAGNYNHEQIPVFLELKRFRDPALDIKACITKEFETCGFPDPEKFTEYALKSGDLLILLDGLDEVLTDNFNTVVQSIKDFSDQYSDNRFITSCRIAAYNTYFTGFKTVAIAEFDDDQIFDFIKNWFQADPNPLMTKEKKAEYANTIWEQLKTSDSIGTKELSQTPLLLTFVCLVFRQKKTITVNRAKLYSKALDILLEEWAKSKLLEENWEIYQDLSADLEKDMLASIAYVGLEEDKLFFEKDELAEQISAFLTDNLNAPKHLDANRVIDAIAVQQGILIERATDVYSFSHLTLQEYLCAEYIRDWNCQDKLVENHATDQRWHEVFFLVTGLMGRAAISLLEMLETQTHLHIDQCPKLDQILSWLKDKTAYSTQEYSDEIKRLFALVIIIDCIYTLALESDNTDLTQAQYLSVPLDSAVTLTHKLTRSSSLVPSKAYNFISFLPVNQARTYRSFAQDHPSALISTCERTSFVLEHELLTNVDLQLLITKLKDTFVQLDHESDFAQASIEELALQIPHTLQISPELLDLTIEEIEVVTSYLSTCQLMIDCSKQASGLSAQQWEAIKQRMFLPKPTV